MARIRQLAAIGGLLLAAFTATAAAAPAHPVRARGSVHRSPARTDHRRVARCAARHSRACQARSRRHLVVRKTPRPASHAVQSVAPAAQASSAATAAAVAATLAVPCENTTLTPEAANMALARAAVLCLINQERAQHGEAPLRPSPQLEAAAEGHCSEMIADDYFDHISPSGETPVDRIRMTGYIPAPSDGYIIGENLAWGTYDLSTPQAIVEAWLASPGHLANILEDGYTETGIGIVASVPSSLGAGAPGATYAQEFGRILE